MDAILSPMHDSNDGKAKQEAQTYSEYFRFMGESSFYGRAGPKQSTTMTNNVMVNSLSS